MPIDYPTKFENIHKETIRAINELISRLENGQAKFSDFYIAINSKLTPMTGITHTEPDEKLLQALKELAAAATIAFIREKEEIIKSVSRDLGRGVAIGKFGSNFFDKIGSEKKV